jgi:Putative peptidoglycan binding domain
MSTETERTTDLGFARPRPVADDDDRPFRESLEELSRQLAARRPHEPPPFDPKAAEVEQPLEPTKPARQSSRRSPVLPLLALVLGVALAAVVRAMITSPPEPQTPRAAIVTPPPLPNPVPPPSAAEIAPAKKPVTVDPPAPPVAPVVIAVPEPAATTKGKLEGYEIMEIQTRLKVLGLNPGPLDGLSGAQTVAAVKQYEASKSRPQTGKLDRELLKQLRQEPKEQAPAK